MRDVYHHIIGSRPLHLEVAGRSRRDGFHALSGSDCSALGSLQLFASGVQVVYFEADVVDAVVDQVAAAIIPKPVPLVVPAVSGERMFWRGSEPEVLIDASGQPGRFGAILQNVCLTPHRCAVVVITLFHWFFEKLFACSALSVYDDIRTALESSLCERHR